MDSRKNRPVEIFSKSAIALSLALISGMAMGHITEQSMHARLSATPPADPVDRYALGQNAYNTPRIPARTVRAQHADLADASYEVGRYRNGTRILAPAEPARKIERMRLERLQDWNEENFGDDSGRNDEAIDYAASDNYAPIDVGAVIDAPEATAGPVFVQVAARSDRN